MPKEACVLIEIGPCCALAFCFVVSGDEDFDVNVVSRSKDAEIAADAEGNADYNNTKKSGKGAAMSIELVCVRFCACAISFGQAMVVAAAQVATITPAEENAGKRSTPQEVCTRIAGARAYAIFFRLVC